MTPTGLEPGDVSTLSDNELHSIAFPSAAESDATGARNGDFDADLQAVIDAWPTLPEATRADITAMVERESPTRTFQHGRE